MTKKYRFLISENEGLTFLNPIIFNFRDLLEKNYKYQKELF
jgi:hypothetical protein